LGRPISYHSSEVRSSQTLWILVKHPIHPSCVCVRAHLSVDALGLAPNKKVKRGLVITRQSVTKTYSATRLSRAHFVLNIAARRGHTHACLNTDAHSRARARAHSASTAYATVLEAAQRRCRSTLSSSRTPPTARADSHGPAQPALPSCPPSPIPSLLPSPNPSPLPPPSLSSF
jgi:hypothetical protein